MAHTHPVVDGDHHFIIDPITRAVTNAESKKMILMQNDHNSERFTFEIDKLVEGHDMALCNRVEIHYVNQDTNRKNKNSGVYEVKDVEVSEVDSNKLTFSWLISENATLYAGSLQFLVMFKCVEKGETTYRWNSNVNASISIAKGMNNGEEIEETYPDILEQWKLELFAAVFGMETVSIGPVEPETYPYIWFDTSGYFGTDDNTIGQLTVKDVDGNKYALSPVTQLKATDAATIEQEQIEQRKIMAKLEENDNTQTKAIGELEEASEKHSGQIENLQKTDADTATEITSLKNADTDISNRVTNSVTDLTNKDAEILSIANSKSATDWFTVTIPTTGWTGDGPYTQNIAVEGVLEDSDSCAIIFARDPNHKDEFDLCGVDAIGQSNGYITFTVESIPEAAFPVNVMLVFQGVNGPGQNISAMEILQATAIQKETSGSKILRINDSAEMPILDMHVDEATDVKIYGKNILPKSYFTASGTINGVTFTKLDNGNISITGTTSDSSTFELVRHLLLPEGDYVFSIGDIAKSGLIVRLDWYTPERVWDSRAGNVGDGSNSYTVIHSDGIKHLDIYVSCYTAESIDYILTPQLEVGSIATGHEEYKTPKEFSINSSGYTGMLNHRLFRPVTTVVSNANMSVRYVADPKTYYDNLVASTVSEGGDSV